MKREVRTVRKGGKNRKEGEMRSGQAGNGNLISGTHSSDVSLFSLFSTGPLYGRLLSSSSKSLSNKGHLHRQTQLRPVNYIFETGTER